MITRTYYYFFLMGFLLAWLGIGLMILTNFRDPLNLIKFLEYGVLSVSGLLIMRYAIVNRLVRYQ